MYIYIYIHICIYILERGQVDRPAPLVPGLLLHGDLQPVKAGLNNHVNTNSVPLVITKMTIIINIIK